MHRRHALIAVAIVLGALPGCNALFGRDVQLDQGSCATPPRPCSAGAQPVAGDWNGDGRTTPGLFDGGRWCITDEPSASDMCLDFHWGAPGDTPVVGDWNGDRIDDAGWFRKSRWSLKGAGAGGDPADFRWGSETIQPLAGDWDGRGHDTPGGARDLEHVTTWSLSNHNSAGGTDHSFDWGISGAIRLVGDWDGDGTDTPAWFSGGIWTFSQVNRQGGVAASFQWGGAQDVPLVGDWDGDGVDTAGLYNSGQWTLANDHIDTVNRTLGPTELTTFRWGTE